MTEQTATAARTAEFEGPDQIVAAVRTLLTSPELDLVVVRKLLRRRALRRLRPGDPGRRAVLAAGIPRLGEVADVIDEWWDEHGYPDHRFVRPGFDPGNHRAGSLVPHLDPPEGAYLYGPVTLSVVTSRTPGMFLAERTPDALRDDTGRFDPDAFARLLAAADGPELRERRLRTAIRQGPGDGVLFTNHPTPSYHAVEADPAREAHLFECVVESRQ
jgi:hypothetical protein